MKQAAIMVRVSTLLQDFNRQISDLKVTAKSMGYEVKDDNIYSEKVSGLSKKDDRKELVRFVSDIKNGKKIDMLFVTEMSRISRVPRIGSDFVEELAELKVPVHVQNMKRASLNDDGSRESTFFIMMSILLEFSATETKDTKERQKSGRQHNFKEGRNHGAKYAKYGYDVAPRDNERKAGKIIINEKEAEVVKMVFEMYIQGSGMKVIANHCNNLGIKSKTGGDWTITTVNNILKGEIYYGSRIYKGQLFENIVPAIITKKTFDTALAVSEERDVSPSRNVRYLYLLQQKAKCGYCGVNYVPKFSPSARKKVSNKLYHCGTRHRGGTCDGCGIGIDKLESVVWNLVTRNNAVLDFLKKNNSGTKTAAKEITALELQVTSLEYDLSQKNEQMKKVKKMYKLGKSTDKELIEDLTTLELSMKHIEERIKNAQEQIKVKAGWIKSFNTVTKYTEFLNNLGEDRVKLNEIMKVMVEKVNITSVAKLRLSKLYIITVNFTSGIAPVSVLFNKNPSGTGRPLEYRMEYYSNPDAAAMVKYENDILVGDIDKLVAAFQKPYLRLDKKGKVVMFKGQQVLDNAAPTWVSLIPFEKVNIHDKKYEALVKPRVPRSKLIRV